MTTGPNTINWLPGGDYSFGFRLAYIPGTTDVEDSQQETRLLHAIPNPSPPNTTISFTVNRHQSVSVIVYDMPGRQVAVLTNEVQKPGTHTAYWNGLDSAGQAVSSGTYFVRLRTQDIVESRRIVLVR